jgi:hypothetical protein
VGAFGEELVSKLLELPSFHRPVALIPMGKPGQHTQKPGRRPLAEVYSEID